MDCGCESGKRYEYDFSCAGCMARHYIDVLSGPTKFNLAQCRARYKQLKAAWPEEKFAEWWRLVEQEREQEMQRGAHGIPAR